MFDTGMVHIVVPGDIVDHYCFLFDRGVVHIVVADYNADQYCFMFDIGVVHIFVAGYIVNHYTWGLTEEWFILLWLTIMLTIYV
jgi:hypothetical protein